MQDDKTVFKPPVPPPTAPDADRTVIFRPGLQVFVQDGSGKTLKDYFFMQGFTAGRGRDNAVVLESGDISRHHIEVKRERGEWRLVDLNSANGVFIDGLRLERETRLTLPALVQLGNAGIFLKIQAAGQPGLSELPKPGEIPVSATPPSSTTPTQTQQATDKRQLSREAVRNRLMSTEEAEDAGEYTRMVRTLIREDRVVRSKKYNQWISVLAVLFLIASCVVTYQRIALSNARTLAIDLFYDIKTLEVSLSRSEITIESSAQLLEQMISTLAQDKLLADQERIKAEQERIKAEQEKIAAESRRLAQERKRLQGMKAKYQEYVQEAESLRIRFPTAARYEEELIAKVAREFGESELELPDDFVDEVRRYIKYWQASSRMPQAMATLENNGYAQAILAALDKEGLPLHFIYLPLQESNYDTMAVGPETRFGIAKGAWQLLASTGEDFGLKTGPLAATRNYDEQDQRFDFNQATRAGAKYLKLIYSTEAQASGLLVIASYNYGQNRVREMIKKMPDNPRDKNFWKFIQQYQIPKETYDYVFYIFSAAVIGEDPKHFGFKFNPPLLSAVAKPG
ncbi:FHA domain-containing protein [Methylomicrobium sp. Wu6]|uniref:FHA domain-containing protein n=1 Tax=Methylomicrobium sp. Wu6 TaxID=3107928 RepID=UPI002DD677BD|nr:FHA domain-containing protein [Methylomicrobium sp. Wu6]MEC4750112.1 FHA domain-containing protein [Methylomicrobium sp. Wu6]